MGRGGVEPPTSRLSGDAFENGACDNANVFNASEPHACTCTHPKRPQNAHRRVHKTYTRTRLTVRQRAEKEGAGGGCAYTESAAQGRALGSSATPAIPFQTACARKRCTNRAGNADRRVMLMVALIFAAWLSPFLFVLVRERPAVVSKPAAVSIDSAAAACARWDDSVRVLPEGGPTCAR